MDMRSSPEAEFPEAERRCTVTYGSLAATHHTEVLKLWVVFFLALGASGRITRRIDGAVLMLANYTTNS